MGARKVLVENAIENIQSRATQQELEVGKKLMEALAGDRKASRWLQEAISTSDIPTFMTPAINAIFLAQFADAPVVWDQIAEEYRTDRYTNIEWYGFDVDTSDVFTSDGEGYDNYGLPGVAELGEYPAASFTTETLEGELRKWGLRFRMAWEVGLKTGNFQWLPQVTARMARFAAEQEDKALALKFVSSAGVINPAFTDAPSNPALTLDALEDAILQSQTVEVNGRRSNASSFKLVTGYGLSRTARDILAITQIERTAGTDTLFFSPSIGGVSAVAFDALDKVGGAPVANDWFLVPQGTIRPAFLELFHEDHRLPMISVKNSNQVTISGGAIGYAEGSFDTDDIETRVRHLVGAEDLTPQIVIASNGTGA